MSIDSSTCPSCGATERGPIRTCSALWHVSGYYIKGQTKLDGPRSQQMSTDSSTAEGGKDAENNFGNPSSKELEEELRKHFDSLPSDNKYMGKLFGLLNTWSSRKFTASYRYNTRDLVVGLAVEVEKQVRERTDKASHELVRETKDKAYKLGWKIGYSVAMNEPGGTQVVKCTDCNGSGEIHIHRDGVDDLVECDECEGSGLVTNLGDTNGRS